MTKSMVDNSGMGNCMYYTYAISLMYHLRNEGKVEGRRYNRMMQQVLNYKFNKKSHPKMARKTMTLSITSLKPPALLPSLMTRPIGNCNHLTIQ
jgi:predicted nucleotidyltransferase